MNLQSGRGRLKMSKGQEAGAGEAPAKTESSLRAELKEMIAKKDQIEKEIRDLTRTLREGGFEPRGKKNLVDKDGFPTADMDKIITVREAQGKISSKEHSLNTIHL
jgi:hypothetical protein